MATTLDWLMELIPESPDWAHEMIAEEIESLRAKLKEKDETLQELQTKLAETEKDKGLLIETIWSIKKIAMLGSSVLAKDIYEIASKAFYAAIAKGEE